jgi:hypothetical protein
MPTLQSRMVSTNLEPGDVSIPILAPLGGTALLFDGVDDCVRIPYRTPGTPQAPKPYKNFSMTGDFTLEMWVRAASVSPARTGSAYADGTGVTYTAIACQWNNVATNKYPFALWYDTATGFVMASRWAGGTATRVMSSQPAGDTTNRAAIDDGYYHRIIVSRYTDTAASKSYLQLAIGSTYWWIADNAGTIPDNGLDITIGQCNNQSQSVMYSAFKGSITRVTLWNHGFSMFSTPDFVYGGTAALPNVSFKLPTPLLTPASMAVGQWLCNEGYGPIVFDRAGLNHGRLEEFPSGVAGPTWVVSSALDLPRNVVPSGG